MEWNHTELATTKTAEKTRNPQKFSRQRSLKKTLSPLNHVFARKHQKTNTSQNVYKRHDTKPNWNKLNHETLLLTIQNLCPCTMELLIRNYAAYTWKSLTLKPRGATKQKHQAIERPGQTTTTRPNNNHPPKTICIKSMYTHHPASLKLPLFLPCYFCLDLHSRSLEKI